MKILVLGGTQMLGRDFVELISNKFDDITIANRGITNPNLFINFKKLIIDRNHKNTCKILSNFQYNIIVDFSCYNINQFENTINYINSKKYIYISTTSVFDEKVFIQPDVKNEYYKYCYNKRMIENYIKEKDVKCLIVRPCAVYGDYDYTNRFYKKNNEFYWKSNNEKVSTGAIYVKDISNLLLKYINEDFDINEVNICK